MIWKPKFPRNGQQFDDYDASERHTRFSGAVWPVPFHPMIGIMGFTMPMQDGFIKSIAIGRNPSGPGFGFVPSFNGSQILTPQLSKDGS
jgi:hypothetical protein